MAVDVTLTEIISGYQTDKINANFEAIETAFADALSRSNTAPNNMGGDLDLNGYSIINAGNLQDLETSVNWSWQGPWVTATDYTVNNLVSKDGSTYVCIEAHTSGTFSTDLAAEKWQVVASRGASGPGSGDFLADGTVPMTDDIQMGGSKVTDLGDGSSDSDAAAIGQVVRIDAAQSLSSGEKTQARDNIDALDSTGDTMSGTLAMADNTIERAHLTDYSEKVNNIGAVGGGTQDIDYEDGPVVLATINISETTFTFSNPPATGRSGAFVLYLTNPGSQTINWPASVIWDSGAVPTFTVSGLDVLVFETHDGGTTWHGFVAGLGLA